MPEAYLTNRLGVGGERIGVVKHDRYSNSLVGHCCTYNSILSLTFHVLDVSEGDRYSERSRAARTGTTTVDCHFVQFSMWACVMRMRSVIMCGQRTGAGHQHRS